ncbi:MAG: conjugal transfer protein TrbE [Sulfurovum sp.]|nr:conjugal transfer protein TrbE [Sulfurovum sp.]
MINLKNYRSTAKGLPDLLNYAACIGPGLYLNKDGSLTAAFSYQASDIFSATALERNTIAKRMNSVLSKFGNGWVIHIDSVRFPTKEYPKNNECYFKDIVSELIDDERREYFMSQDNLYETLHIITLTYQTPNKSKSKITDIMFDDSSTQKDESIGSKVIKEFETKVSEFQSLSSNVFIKIERLIPTKYTDEHNQVHYNDKFLQYLNFCIVGRNHPVQLPHIAMYLDRYLGGYDFWTGIIPKVDDKYIGIVAIDGYPQQSHPNILDKLSKLSLEYRWNTRFLFLDNYEAETRLAKLMSKWKQKVKGIFAQIFLPEGSGNINEHALAMVDEVRSAKAEVNSGLLTYGYYTSNIVIMNKDRAILEQDMKEVARIIEAEGFSARIETINAVEAWLGTLPSHSVQNVRGSLVNSFNLSHLMPISSVWAGDRYNPSDKYPPSSPPISYTTTSGSTPFRLNLHVSDIGHTLIFGPTGSGKSTLLAFLASQHRRYAGARIYAFDKGMSMFPIVKAAQGDHYDVAGDNNELAFAPLANLKTKIDQAWAETWIASMIELQNIQLIPSHKEMIHEAMSLHREQGSKSLTEFISNLQNEELRSALSHYSISGAMGHLLDAEEDTLTLSDFAVFEIEELMNLKDEDAVPVLLYLFHKIEKSLDGRPTMLILDEAWLMLGHKVFRDKIREWLKVLRKANCQVILATQSLSDASNSGILDVLQESCPTKIMLANPYAFNKGSENNSGPYDFYKQFGMNDRQIEILTDAIPKQEYYYFSPLGTRLFNLSLEPITLAFVGASGKEDIKAIKKLIEQYGKENWIPKWLERRGINPQKYFDIKEKYEN